MPKKIKIFAAILIAVAVFAGLVSFVAVFLSGLLLPSKHAKGKLTETFVSPEGKWKVRLYDIELGAMASDIHYARVTDLKGKIPPRDIPISAQLFKKQRIHWINADVVDIYGAETNVRTAEVLEDISVSPTGRWKVKIYYYPITNGRRSWDGASVKYFYYAVIADLKGKAPIHKVNFDESKIRSGTVRWKSANVIDVYGFVIDARPATQS